ncbi:MAG: hypothetical protein ABSB90_01260 [Thermoplasmata archaeon]|jgi:hypothetical protein
MSRRALILAVVVLLIASSMVVLGTSAARGATAPTPSVSRAAPVHPSVSSIELETASGEYPNFGYNITYFNSGNYDDYGSNVLYFAVYDPTADSKVTFTITDPNASRDGVGNPAFQTTVPINNTTGLYYSTETGVSFTFPADLKIGGGWNVSVSGALGGNASYPIFVGTYYEDIYGSPYPGGVVLPGESVTTAYGAYSEVNGAPVSTITNVSYYGTYVNSTGTTLNLFSSPANGIVTQPASGLGSYTWKVPANASYDTTIDLSVWVSIYVGGHQAENESYGVEYWIGAVYLDSFRMASNSGNVCPSYYDSYYDSGSLVQVCAIVGAFGGEDQFTPVAGLSVAVNFWNGNSVVTPTGFTSPNLVSNASGEIAFSFEANDSQFSSYYQAPFYNTVNLTVTNPGAAKIAPPDSELWDNESFYVYPSGASVGVTVALNQLSYFPGQTITATWTIDSTNSAATGPVTATQWYLESYTSGYLGQGAISSTSNTGTLTVTLPSGFTGEFYLEVAAANATNSFYGEVLGYVTSPVLSLNPSSTTFTPGSTVTIQAQAWGDGSLSSPVITYQVYAEFGNDWTTYGEGGIVSSGTVTNGSSISIVVPSAGAPSQYWVYAYLSSASSGTVATNYIVLNQSWGYNVFIGVSTLSSYSDGSYQPGQTVTVAYSISPYGNAPLPVVYTFMVGLVGTQISGVMSTTSTSGTFQLTIPSGWQTGVAILQMKLVGTYLYGNSCYGGACEGMSAITINAHPSALSMEIGAGSGLTVGWLILLILILVVLIVLVLLIRRKSKLPPSSGGSPPVTTPMNPPAPAPSGPGAAAWQEPTSPPPASDGQPPMPSPPPGAT